MKKYDLLSLLVPICLILSLVTATYVPAAAVEPIHIGVIVPLSGNLAHLGSSIRDGFLLWKERHPGSRLDFIFEDDQFQPRLSAIAAHKLISTNNVSAIVTFTSGPGMAVSSIAAKNRVVHICLTVDSRMAKGHYNFVHLFQSRDAARRLLMKLQAEGVKRVGIMRFIEDAAELSASELIKQANSYGVTIVFHEAFPAGITDFRSIITLASKKDAEYVMVIALPPELELLVKQMRDLRFRPKLTTIETFSISTEPRLFDGSWFVQPAFADQSYAADFHERFGTSAGWGHYADNVASLLESASLAGATSNSLADKLLKLKDIPSTVGPLSADDEGIFAVPVVVAVMKDGITQLLER